MEDCVLSGTFIPKGTTVNMYLHGAHLDPKHWENPKEFRPERWDVCIIFQLEKKNFSLFFFTSQKFCGSYFFRKNMKDMPFPLFHFQLVNATVLVKN